MLIAENKVLINKVLIDGEDGTLFNEKDYFIKFEKEFLAVSKLSTNSLDLKSLNDNFKSKRIVLKKYDIVHIKDISVTKRIINNIHHYQALLTFNIHEGNKVSHVISLLDWNDDNSISEYNIENISITIQDPFEFLVKKSCLNNEYFYISNIEKNTKSTKLGYIKSLFNEKIFTISLFDNEIEQDYSVSKILSCEINIDNDLVLFIETYNEETEARIQYVLIYQEIEGIYKLVYKKSEVPEVRTEEVDDEHLEIVKNVYIRKVLVDKLDVYIYYTEHEGFDSVKNNFIKIEKDLNSDTYIEKRLKLFYDNEDPYTEEDDELTISHGDDITELYILDNGLLFLFDESDFRAHIVKRLNDDNFVIINSIDFDLKHDILNINAVYNDKLDIVEVRYISN